MGSTFNPHILVEKLSKLNNSQASIETLSHWCIFHMNKAKQVVETWDRQFHCSARDRRLAFLYLANDILQNSRRKGAEFVGEFWKVLPDALRDVIDHGDEFGRNAAMRLIGIWEERKVFGSRGQILKDELVGRHLENSNRNGKPLGTKLKQPVGTFVDKIGSSYQAVYGGQLDEDALLRKCRDAISCIEKVDKEVSGDISTGQQNGSAYAQEAQGQNATLRDCIEQLIVIESSRASLVSCLKEALQEQESKLEQIRNQLQAAHSQSERAGNICRQFLNHDSDKSSKEVHASIEPNSYVPGNNEQSAPVMYTQQDPYTEKTSHVEEDPRKSAAAAVAAKLTASTSSAQMLSFVLSSLASEGIMNGESSTDAPLEKRPKLEGDQSPYIPSQISQLPPHPSSSSPLLLPPPLMPGISMPQFMQSTIGSIPYMPQQPPPLDSYQTVGASVNGVSPFTVSPNSYQTVGPSVNGILPFTAPPNPHQSFQGSEGNTNFYTQQSSVPMTPVSRQ